MQEVQPQLQLHPAPAAAGAPCPAAAALGGDGRRLALRAVEIEGFKSYRGRVVVGDPFGDFTCVVGPNGCGKSVVGEAIAFALGGNARMMRARNLGSLVNSSPGMAAPVAAAEVVLRFEILPPAQQQQQEPQEQQRQPLDEQQRAPAGQHMLEQEGQAQWGKDSSSCDGQTGSSFNAVPKGGSSSPAASAGGAAEPLGCLLVRRRVTKGGRSDLSVCHLPALPPAPATAAAAAPSSVSQQPQGAAAESVPSAVHSGSKGSSVGGKVQWQSTTPAALRELLAPFGIQTEAVDRFIVTQHRQAVQVQDPVQLARFLELLIGTAGFEERLAALGETAAGQAAEYDGVEERMAGLALRRQHLAPAVAKWRQYKEQARQYEARKMEVLGQQARQLEGQVALMRRQVTEAAAAAAQHASEQAAAKAAADELLAHKAAVSKEAKQAEREHARLAKQATAAQLERTRLGVQLEAARAAAGQAGGGGGGRARQALQKQAAQAEQEAAKHRKATLA